MNVVLETYPGDQRGGECNVEESLVRYGEDNESWSESQEDDDKAMKVVTIGL